MEEDVCRMSELSEEKAAQILRNVFDACGVPENKTPFQELLKKSREHMGTVRQNGGI